MNKKTLILLPLIGLTLVGCSNIPSEESSSSFPADSKSENTSSEILSSSSSEQEGISSEESSSSKQEESSSSSENPTPTYKSITLYPYNFDEELPIEMNDIKYNDTYKDEFTIASSTGVIKSNRLGNIGRIMVHSYGYYDNLKVCDSYTDGNVIKGVKVEKNKGESVGNLFTYDLNGSSSFRIENPAKYDVEAFSITIEYTGDIIPPNYQEISIARANEIGSSLSGLDSSIYRLKGKVSNIDGTMVTITNGNDSIIVENIYIDKYMYPNYKVSLKGRIENRDGEILFVRSSLLTYKEATYSLAISQSENGNIEASKISNLHYGEKVTLNITPSSEYVLRDLYVNEKNHNFFNDKATITIKGDTLITGIFGKDFGNDYVSKTYLFSSYAEGEDNAKGEVHKLDENTSINVSSSFFSNELTIHQNGEVLLSSLGNIKELAFTSFSNGELSFLGEGDSSFQEISNIALNGKNRYVLDLSSSFYKGIKIKNDGNDVVLSSISLTYLDETNKDEFDIHSIEINGTYGDSNLITYKNYDILVDGGTAGTRDNLKNAIDSYVTDGVLDLLVISHPDSDHYYGITYGDPFENIFEVKQMITNDNEDNEEVVSYVKERFPNVEYHKISEFVSPTNLIHTLDVDSSFNIDFYYHPGFATKNKNNQSVAMMINYQNTKLFMAGDMEQNACNNFMRTYQSVTSDSDFAIFKLLHHASKGSNAANFLTYLKPDFAFVTAGMKCDLVDETSEIYMPNYNTHPYLETSLRIGAITKDYYWSGITGELTISCDGNSAKVLGKGRGKDYYVFDKEENRYLKTNRLNETCSSFFTSYWYQNAVINNDATNFAGVDLYA